LIRQTGQTVGQVARGLHLTETAVRQWVKQADQDAGQRIDGLTTVERLHLPAPVHGRNASSSPWSGCIAFRT
jgi:transposase